jgi:hypothetical protein
MKSQHLSRTSDGLSRTCDSTLAPPSTMLISYRQTDDTSISKSLCIWSKRDKLKKSPKSTAATRRSMTAGHVTAIVKSICTLNSASLTC